MTIKTVKWTDGLTPEEIKERKEKLDRLQRRQAREPYSRQTRQPYSAYVAKEPKTWFPEDGPNVLPMSERGFKDGSRMPRLSDAEDDPWSS